MPLRSRIPTIALLVLASCSDSDQVGSLSGYGSQTFGIGIPAYLSVADEDGADLHDIEDAHCVEGCTIAQEPDSGTPRWPTWFIAPLAPTFRLHVRGRKGSLQPIVDVDVNGTAEPVDLDRSTRGAGPGVAVLPGTVWTWSWGPGPNVAFAPVRGTAEIDGPFELLSARGFERTFDASIQATSPGDGTVTFTIGTHVQTAKLSCVDVDSVRDVALAPRATAAPFVVPAELAAGSTKSVTLAVDVASSFWVMFTTAEGAIGLAGAGDAVPAPLSPFEVRQEPLDASNDQPSRDASLVLRGTRRGRSTLKLRVGTVVADVEVMVQ